MSKIYNRDVFVLIDRSGSMWDDDYTTKGQTRYKYLQETVRGHVAEILDEEDFDDGTKICDRVIVYFFNVDQPPATTNNITDISELKRLFKENKPGGATFIAPTLKESLAKFFNERTDNRGAFIIIYTDGVLDDREKFVQLIEETCQRIDSQDEVKILMIGIGADVQKEKAVEYYLDLDVNANQFKSRNGEDCNIFIFNLIDDVMGDGIVAALERQLGDNPRQGLASWVQERYPALYKKYFG